MAIKLADYLEQAKSQREKELKDLISQDIRTELSRRRGEITTGREQFIRSQISPTLQAALNRAGISGEAGSEESIQREEQLQLERPLEQSLIEIEFEAETQRLNQLYQQAFRLAVIEGNANEQQARKYALQVVDSQRRREAFAQEAEAERQKTRGLVSQEEEQARSSIELYKQSLQPNIDYGSLIAGALSRLGGQLIGFKTTQFLNRPQKGVTQFDTQENGNFRAYPQLNRVTIGGIRPFNPDLTTPSRYPQQRFRYRGGGEII